MSDLKAETRALLELGRGGDEPSDLALAMNRRKLAAKLGAAALASGAIAGSAAPAAAASAGAWLSAKVMVLGGALLLGGAAVGVLARNPAPAVPPAASVVQRSVPVTSVDTSLNPTAPAAAESAQVVASEPAKPPPRASAPAALSGARSIQSELELIRAAQKHLHRSEARAALSVLAEHARRFPNGALSEEREASRVLSLCQLGDASEQAQRFVQRAPNSPFVDRVRASCRLKTQ